MFFKEAIFQVKSSSSNSSSISSSSISIQNSNWFWIFSSSVPLALDIEFLQYLSIIFQSFIRFIQ